MGKECLHPPPSFVQIANGIYCSGAIYPTNFTFLRRIRLAMVVTLSPNETIHAVEEFYKEEQIQHQPLGIEIQDRANGDNDQLIIEALDLLLDQRYHPILFHSTSNGSQEIGLLVGCFRKIQYWNLTSIINEYRKFVGHPILSNEQYIERYDIEQIQLPQNLPQWFIDEKKMMEEEILFELDHQEQSSQ